ncbi:MAG: WD40 repeat domain-containing protein [Candidatus Asgardarchaeia archaeon]
MRVWDAATGKLLRTLEGHSNSVLSVAWSPDSKALVISDGIGNIVIWNMV